ncbi:hypothetical protein [Actinoplanes teichomyceticus]|uniref:Parallel beta helix pectate lyase-like protein n=1 Tax=Actinoplanes teichomyceticus TaxID=1867 RepID=A0A561WSJ2_ACTTI|nr:hypothetical protein [Actinoplanes teichomyceticus]TWG26845.1 hypothetical protein FHX34_1011845 [Actinoplanes teichomyceticus]GIF15244.1 hypothetical protein Ate01nite_52760 [Actinoplanes teichomyceticus]
MTYRPSLGGDPLANHRLLQDLLDTRPPGQLELPPGAHPLAEGLRVPGGWTVRGSSATQTWLVSESTTGHPVLHVLGSGVSISDLGLRPAPSDPGEHGGDRGTGLTIGEYLYPGAPEWISDVDVHRVHVDHGALRTANAIGVMGAVRRTVLHDVQVTGGWTGVAVHWGAAGSDVSSITGPTYHPHRLTVSDLRVRGAIEGFYLSSVHDVRVSGACLRDVEMGFRLLPGDNADRFVSSSEDVGARIEVDDVCVRWTGPRYAVRIAGWGRSEVDGVVSVLAYRDSVVRDCRLAGSGTGHDWSPVRFERACGVELRDVTVTTGAGDCCRLGTPD